MESPLFRFEGVAPCPVLTEQAYTSVGPLRTAERARASILVLDSSYKEPTVDALASTTDEGRG
jgi:hypothetical protein